MPTCPIRCAASLLACAGVLVAADNYSYDDLSKGNDINEGVYGSHGGGEFDEWRLTLGLAPGIDRIRIKTEVDGAAYPGPAAVENDRVYNDPALAPQIGLLWVLGDFQGPDHGWFYTLGLEYTRRDYTIIYELGAESQELTLQALTAQVGMGYAWYMGPSWRYEFEPFVSVGLMWNEMDLIDLASQQPTTETAPGPVFEGGIRNALIWHPGSQEWHIGVAVDYRVGYATSSYVANTLNGNVESKVELNWHGFGSALFYGHKF